MKTRSRFGRIDAVTQVLRKEYSGPERDWLPPERALARDLKVSRPLLREAIKRLQMQGYLEPIHGVGVRVIHHPTAPIKTFLESQLSSDRDRQRQFAELRCLVEPQIAAWAASKAAKDPKNRERLHSIHENMRAAPTYEGQVKHDIDFHRCIAELAQNPRFTAACTRLRAWCVPEADHLLFADWFALRELLPDEPDRIDLIAQARNNVVRAVNSNIGGG